MSNFKAMETLKSIQDNLCLWLSSDPDYILELDQCGDILSGSQYRKVKGQSSAAEQMRMLLQMIIESGQDACQSFYETLKEHQAHYQQLQQFFIDNAQGSCRPKVFADGNGVVTAREIKDVKAKSFIMTINTRHTGSGQSESAAGPAPQADYVARRGGVICADIISGATIDGVMDFSVNTSYTSTGSGLSAGASGGGTMSGGKHFVDKHRQELIKSVSTVSPILDGLMTKGVIDQERNDNIMSRPIPQDQMRELYKLLNAEEAKDIFYDILENQEPYLMAELKKKL